MGYTILLDMDGPLADFDVHGLAWAESIGIEAPKAWTSRFWDDHLPKHHRSVVRRRFEQPGWFRELPITPGAQQGVETLRSDGAEVWVVTKPMETNPTCRDEKAAWLREHFPWLEKRLILAPDKSLIRGQVLVDDAPKPDWIPRADWTPVIFPAPFNGPDSQWGAFDRWEWAEGVDALYDICDRVIAANKWCATGAERGVHDG